MRGPGRKQVVDATLTLYNGFSIANPSTPSYRSFLTPATTPPARYSPRNRGHALIAAYCITLALALAAAARRYFVRYTRSQSTTFKLSVFIPEDYVLLFSVSCISAFAGLGIYGCVALGWGLMENRDWTVEQVEKSWQLMYIAQIISWTYMTTIRLDLFSFFRRIYARTNSRCRFCCVAMIILSLSYLILAVPLSTTLFCGSKYAAASFDLWTFVSGKCYNGQTDRNLRTALASVEAILDVTVLCMVMKTVWTLSNQETKQNPGMFVKQAGKPCRPMCGMAFSACVPAFLHIYLASSHDSFDFNTRVMGLICSQIEGALFILVSCAPMLRTLVCPSSQLGVSNKSPYNSGDSSCTRTIGGTSKCRSRSNSNAKTLDMEKSGASSTVTTLRESSSRGDLKGMKCSRRTEVTWSVTVSTEPALPSPAESMPAAAHLRQSSVSQSVFNEEQNHNVGVVETVIRATPIADVADSEAESSVYEDANGGFEFGFSARDAVACTLARTRSLLSSVTSDRFGAGSRASARHSARESQTTIVVGDLEPLELSEGSDSRIDMRDAGIDLFPMPGDSTRSIVGSMEGSIHGGDVEEGNNVSLL